MDERAIVRDVETLSAGWYPLRRYTLDYLRRDGRWRRLTREVCQRGDSVAVLLYAPAAGTVVLTRQFRLPALVGGYGDGMVIEVAGGRLDTDAPTDAARREVEEETGYRVRRVDEVFAAHLNPAVVTGLVHCFVARYDAVDRVGDGGGSALECEDVEVLELRFAEALAMVDRGEIVDAKTIMLLQHARLAGLFEARWEQGR